MILDVREAEGAEIATAAELWQRADSARTGRAVTDDDARAFIESLREAAARPGATLLVGLHKGRLVATAYAVRLRNDPAAAQVAMLGVEPQLWGCGAGSRMLTELTARLADGGCERLRMNVVPDNDRARALYERHGWRHDGEVEQTADGEPPELIYRHVAR